MKPDFTKIYSKYKGMWIALDKTLKKVVGANKRANEVYKEAIDKGYEKPTLFKVPQKNIPYFGFNINET